MPSGATRQVEEAGWGAAVTAQGGSGAGCSKVFQAVFNFPSAWGDGARRRHSPHCPFHTVLLWPVEHGTVGRSGGELSTQGPTVPKCSKVFQGHGTPTAAHAASSSFLTRSIARFMVGIE